MNTVNSHLSKTDNLNLGLNRKIKGKKGAKQKKGLFYSIKSLE